MDLKNQTQKRTIKFRGLRTDGKGWVYGYLVIDPLGLHRIYWKPFLEATSNTYHLVTEKTVGQFTGLQDKNGKECFEGDIVKYFYLKRYTQQSHYDVRPEIDELIIKKVIDKVVFKNGCFIMSKNDDTDENYGYFSPISDYGLHSIESVKEDIFGEMLSQLDEEEQSGDCNGQDIDESIIGIEIIGNIHEHGYLLK